MTTYRVTTWDIDKQAFTPQEGVPELWSKWGLRTALRMLRGMSYDIKRAGAYSVLVEAVDETTPQANTPTPNGD